MAETLSLMNFCVIEMIHWSASISSGTIGKKGEERRTRMRTTEQQPEAEAGMEKEEKK